MLGIPVNQNNAEPPGAPMTDEEILASLGIRFQKSSIIDSTEMSGSVNDETLCTALSGYDCTVCDANLSPWMSPEDAEKPEAAGGPPDAAGVYMYGILTSGDRKEVIFVGRSNTSVRSQIMNDLGESGPTKLREFLQEKGSEIRYRFAVNDDESGCSEMDMICEHWKTARRLPKFSKRWPDRQGSVDQAE